MRVDVDVSLDFVFSLPGALQPDPLTSLLHSLSLTGFKPQEARMLHHPNARMSDQDRAQLAARGQKSAAFVKTFHGLLLVELPPVPASACPDLRLPGSCDAGVSSKEGGGWQANGFGKNGGVGSGGLAALMGGGLHVEGGLPKLMGLQAVEGGAEELGLLMAQARGNWHAALKALTSSS